ncbi:MAG: enoyl-CoA hydratase-related protein [Sinobacteraceae bacterium]|nr:enoyl-CoA hydratase-related protein [Nevskiaceae bacterium]
MVILDRPAPYVARLLINRPDKRNAIDYAVRETLYNLLDEVKTDARVRAVVLGGAGGFLSAGGDTPSMVGLDEVGARERMRHIHRLCRSLLALPLPVVTAVEGMGVGAGVGLALLGDVIVAGPGTKFYFPFFKLGLVPDWASLLTLPRRIGHARAQHLLAHSGSLTGAEAHELGLVDVLAADDSVVMADAVAEAAALAQLPREAYAWMKRMLQPTQEEFDRVLKSEEDAQTVLLQSPGFREGYAAMRDKRTADFVGCGA